MTSTQEQQAMDILHLFAAVEPTRPQAAQMLATIAVYMSDLYKTEDQISITDFGLDILNEMKKLEQ